MLEDAYKEPTLRELAEAAHSNAKNKGFWDNPKERGTRLMLITSELGEALDADREGRFANLDEFTKRLDELNDSIPLLDRDKKIDVQNENFVMLFKSRVKDSYGDELADALIRILDNALGDGVDIVKHVELKMRYNATREKMHGKAY